MKINIKDDNELSTLVQDICTVYNKMKSVTKDKGRIDVLRGEYRFNHVLSKNSSVLQTCISNAQYNIIEYGSFFSNYFYGNMIKIDSTGNILDIYLAPRGAVLEIIKIDNINNTLEHIELPPMSTEITEEYVFQLSTVHEYFSAIIMITELKKRINRKMRVHVPDFSTELIKYIER